MKGFNIARKQIGYCPQFDSIFEGLTVKEHLEIYASMKGIKKSLRVPMVEK
jgi:ABC-type multidrug transport system ATPase subunit